MTVVVLLTVIHTVGTDDTVGLDGEVLDAHPAAPTTASITTPASKMLVKRFQIFVFNHIIVPFFRF